MKEYKLNAKKRDGIGRGPARRLRNSGLIPGIVYGKKGTTTVSIDAVEFRTLMRAKGDAAALIDLTIDGAATLALIKDYQRNALSRKVVHIDILEVDPNEEMTVIVPIRVKGEAYGVVTEGGVLEVSHDITVRCLPKNMPEFIEVDVTELHTGQNIHIDSLPKVEGVVYPKNQNSLIAVCLAPESEEAEETPAADAATPAATPAPAAK